MFNKEQILAAAMHVEDLKLSLERYQNTLKFPLKSHDSFRATLARDAQIYAFCECATILRELLDTLFNPDQKEYESFREFLHDLYSKAILDEGAYTNFSLIALAEEVFRFDRSWVSSQETELFTGCLNDLPKYYQDIVGFARAMSQLVFQFLRVKKQEGYVHERQ